MDKEMLRKGLKFHGDYAMCCAMLLGWELQDGRMSEELLATMTQEELDAKEGS
jgi:hypothetical protein